MATLQDQVIEKVRRRVDAWRGFALGKASEPYPDNAPVYEATQDGDKPLTETSRALLLHWFRPEPHELRQGGELISFKYWPHQRRLVETFIYLHEVRGIRRTEQLYDLCGVERVDLQRDPWTKLGGQLATGSGKTKLMSLLIAWAQLNATIEGEGALGLGRHAILIAPGLFVRDRLLQDFMPPHGGASVFEADPVVPPEFQTVWNLKVYSPQTCPQTLDPDEGALVVTNYHQLLRTGSKVDEAALSNEERQMAMLFEEDDPEKLETVQTPLIERFAESRGLLVLNDEAHHVWDEPGHVKFEETAKAKKKAGASDDAKTAMAWIRSIRRLNGDEAKPGRLGLQVDLSATLFEETGTSKKAKKTEVAQFKEADLFRHTAVRYDLSEAIQDGIVKKPIMELVKVKNAQTGEFEPLVRAGATNAWEKYRNLLSTGIERWKKVRDQLAKEGDSRKPILFILCNEKTEAQQVANFMTYGEAADGDLSSKPVTGCPDPTGGPALFVDEDGLGVPRSTVVQIHIGQKDEANESEWEKIRQAVNAIDNDEIPDPQGRLDESGRPLFVPNPYNVVISVMMLKEGWDVRNVKVIVPLRPCDSRTLTEQTLGRGLRKMHTPVIEEDGSARMLPEELYVIEHPSFRAIIEQIKDLVEEREGDQIKHEPEYVPVAPIPDENVRRAHDVRLIRVESVMQDARDWRPSFRVDELPALGPRLPWQEALDETEILTRLKRALENQDQEGQRFLLRGDVSYRDFDHVIEVAYAVPLLKEIKAGYQHKNSTKSVIREFLERKTFALPPSLPLSFDRTMEANHARIALGNLAREDVMGSVRSALREPIHRAIRDATGRRVELSERRASDLPGHPAPTGHVLEPTRRSPFVRVAFLNDDELRVGVLIDGAEDVTGWVYNTRRIGYVIEYDWQGRTVPYYPDFIVRSKWGEVFHNVIIEVKGRLDDKDRAKAAAGRRWCETLTAHDREPWHYVLLIQNGDLKRTDVTDWAALSGQTIEGLVRKHESLALAPDPSKPKRAVEIVDDVPMDERYRDSVPFYDLKVWAGQFGAAQNPHSSGWARLPGRVLEPNLFVAKVEGHSMERGIPNGAYGLFRAFPVGEEPSANRLDGRRVIVRLEDSHDPETGSYTLKRWRVTKTDKDGSVLEVELRPDNRSFKPISVNAEAGRVRVIAEFVEAVG